MNKLTGSFLASVSAAAMVIGAQTYARANTVWSTTPASSDFNTGANWQGGVAPGAGTTAEFAGTVNSTVTVTGETAAAAAIQVDAGAPVYNFSVTGNTTSAASLTVSGGITDNANNHPSFTVSGVAGNRGSLVFSGTGTAADATITAGNFGTVSFTGTTSPSYTAALMAQSGGTIDFSGTTGVSNANQVQAGSIAGAGNFILGSNQLQTGLLNTSTTISGVISGTGSVTKVGSGTLTITNVQTYTGATNISQGTLALSGAGSIAASSIVSGANFDISAAAADVTVQSVSVSGTWVLGNRTLIVAGGTSSVGGNISGAGGLTVGGALQFTGASTYTGATTINSSGAVVMSLGGSIAASSSVIDNGKFDITGAGTTVTVNGLTGSGSVYLGNNGLTIANASGIFSGVIGVPGQVPGFPNNPNGNGGPNLTIASGAQILTGTNIYTGTTTIASGSLQIGAGGASGTLGTGAVVDNGTLIFNRSDNVSVANAISGSGGFTQAGAGTTTLAAAYSYTGATAVNAGKLLVTGSIAGSAVSVNNGATLGGTGTVGATTVNTGGTLASGAGSSGALAVSGNLTLAAGSTDATSIAPGGANATTVTGAASIGGTLSASYANGTYTSRQYTLISSTGALSGAFTSLAATNTPIGYTNTLSYDANDVYLNLVANSGGFIWSRTPGSSNFNTAGNWQGGVVPGVANVAEFAATTNTSVAIGQANAVQAIQIDNGAPVYNFTITGSATGAASLTLSAGIIEGAGNKPTFTISGISGNTGALIFNGTGTATDAIVTAGAFSTVTFNGTTDAGASATLVAQSGGTVDFSGTTGTAGNKQVTAGSIAGAGNFNLGANTLTTGGLNSSTTVSGVISGSGGLTKTGSGTLTLSGMDTYTGITTISAGSLALGGNGSIAASSGVADNATLDISGTIAGATVRALAGTGGVTLGGQSLTLAGTGAFSGTIFGPGGVTVAGSQTLSGSNLYSGVTTIIGTLLLAGAGSIAASSGVIDNGALDITAANQGVAVSALTGSGSVLLGANTLTIGNATGVYSGAISGYGGVTVAAGTQIFTGSNSYSGITTIGAGVALQIGNGGTSGTLGNNAVIDNGALILNRSDGAAVIGNISGTGSLAQIGTGTGILAVANSYSGPTIIAAGTLQLGTGGTSGTLGSGAVTDNGTLAIYRSNAMTIANPISGSGGLSIAGAGSVVLTGANSYSGTTQINGSFLQVGAGGTAGSLGTGAVIDNGRLTIDRSDVVTLTQAISGTGNFYQLGTGTTILAGTNSYSGTTTIAAGTLAVGTFPDPNSPGYASTLGNGPVINNGNLVFNAVQNVLNNPISGNGNVSFGNAQLFFVTGNNSYSGTTTIDKYAGVQIMGSGSLGSGPVVNNGTLYLGRTDNNTISNPISGTGGVVVQGTDALDFTGYFIIAGAQTASNAGGGAYLLVYAPHGDNYTTLTAVNSYTGATMVEYGGLALSGAGSISASSQVNLVNYGSNLDISGTANGASIKSLAGIGFVYLGSQTLTITGGPGIFSGVIAGSGSVIITGSNEVLAGQSGYTGGTTLGPNAVLTVQTGAALGFGLVTFQAGSKIVFASGATYTQNAVFNKGAPIFDTGGNSVTWAGQMNGPGDLAVTDGGTLILTNATNAYAGGTEVYGNAALQVDTDSELGTPAPLQLGDATSPGTLQFASSFNLDPTRSITLNAGGGVIDTQNFNTAIAQGITGVGGLSKLGSGTLTLAGVSSYAGPTAVNAGTLSVTGSIAPSAVTVASGATLGGTGRVGSTTVASGGTLAPGVGGVGTLTVNGNLTLASGATTQINLTPGANNGIIVSGVAALGGTLVVSSTSGALPNGADIHIFSAGSVTGTFANVTGNVGGLVSNFVYGPNGIDLLLTYPFKNYAGSRNQTAVAATLDANPSSALATAAGFAAVSSSSSPPAVLNQLSGEIHASLRGAAIEDSRILRTSVLGHLAENLDGISVWGAGFGSYGGIATDGNAAGVHRTDNGFIGGVDMPLDYGLRAGIGGAYTDQTINIAARSSSATGTSGHILGYVNWVGGPYVASLGGDYGWGSNQVTRIIAALNEVDRDHQSNTSGQIYGDAGYLLASDDAWAEPHLGITHVSVTTGGFAETGGLGALTGSSQSDSQTYSTLGIRGAIGHYPLGDLIVTPKIDVGWQHSFDRTQASQAMAFTSGQSFTVLGVPLAIDAAAVQAGVDVMLTDHALLSVGYDGSFSSRVQDNAIRGQLTWTF